MKFVLKVLVLVCLVILSKVAKDDALALQKPVIKNTDSNAVYTDNSTSSTSRAPIAETRRAAVSMKFVKGALQVN